MVGMKTVSARALTCGSRTLVKPARREGRRTNHKDLPAAAHVAPLEAVGGKAPYLHFVSYCALFPSFRRNVLRTFVTLSEIQTAGKKAQCDDIQPVPGGGVETNT